MVLLRGAEGGARVSFRKPDGCAQRLRLLHSSPASSLCLIWSLVHFSERFTVRPCLALPPPPCCLPADRRTAAHLACVAGHVETCLLMYEFGADFRFKDRWGHTPLDEALANGHTALVTALGKLTPLAERKPLHPRDKEALPPLKSYRVVGVTFEENIRAQWAREHVRVRPLRALVAPSWRAARALLRSTRGVLQTAVVGMEGGWTGHWARSLSRRRFLHTIHGLALSLSSDRGTPITSTPKPTAGGQHLRTQGRLSIGRRRARVVHGVRKRGVGASFVVVVQGRWVRL